MEKFLALQNGTKNSACCFKIIHSGQVKTICTDEDKYGDTCQYYMLRSVVTLKNLCVK